ncbi:MAG: hypothetical protein Q4D04_02825 [Clostridia bacterium]|nr:hypothetical protein [Clostridia bacterium]
MKKILALLTILALSMACIPAMAEEFDTSDIMSYFSKIEPLENRVSLNIGTDPGIYHNFYTYLAYKLGGLDMVGIDATLIPTSSGPLMVEAMTSGAIDCGGYGIGGILLGSVQNSTVLLAMRMNEAIVQKYYVKADSAIAQAGVNEFGFYGDKASWETAQVYLPAGTTLQYLLGTAMGKLDLTLDQMNTVYTEAPNIFTILASEQGDAWGLWNMTAYDSFMHDGYVEAINGVTGGIYLPAATTVSRAALENPEKVEAIKRWFACEQAVIRWIQASEENLLSAIDYMYEWCENEGVVCTYDVIDNYLHDASPFTLEENLAMFTDRDESGMLTAASMLEAPMDYFVSNGNYTEDDYAKLFDESNYTSEYIEYALSMLG